MVEQTKTNENCEGILSEGTATTTFTSGYLQEVPMTFDEKVKMYMKLSKLELARMLAERDRLGLDYPIPRPYPVPYPEPIYPNYPNPAYPYPYPYPLGPIITYSNGNLQIYTDENGITHCKNPDGSECSWTSTSSADSKA